MSTTSTDPLAPFGKATPEEIQRAHDLVHAIIAGEVDLQISPETFRALHIMHDVLSWVLHFDCGEKVRLILSLTCRSCKERGVTVWRNPPPA